MSAPYQKLYLALLAISLRIKGSPDGLAEEIAIICSDALKHLTLADDPVRRSAKHFDTVRIDGEPAFEIEVRSIEGNKRSDAAVEGSANGDGASLSAKVQP